MPEPPPTIRAALERLIKLDDAHEGDRQWEPWINAIAAARAALEAAQPESGESSLMLAIDSLTEDRVKALVEAVAAAVTAAGGYELGSGGGDGAQLVDGEWWQPEYGCDSLGMTLGAIRARLASAIGSWYGGCLKVVPVESPAAPPAPLEGEAGELVAWLKSLEGASIWFEPGSPEDRNRNRAATLLAQFAAAAPAVVPVAIPGEQWHEDDGACLWWRFPIDEPPWAGDPRDDDWPGYHTHFTRIDCPVLPAPQDGEAKK